MSEHPSSWIEVNLGELLQFNYGKSLPNRIRSGTGFPVYGSNGVVGYHDSALTDRETLIIGRKGSVGEVHFSTRSCYPIDTTYYVDQFHSMPARYWLYLLKNLRLNELNKATAIPGLNREDAYRTKINLAPLNEQKRIADKLDALLARVDACRKSLDRISLILKRFRQSVLAAATSGQLTEDWRDIHSTNKMARWVSLEDVASKLSYGSSAKSSPSGSVPVLRMGNIQDAKLDWNNLVFTSDIKEIEKYQLLTGDVLFNRTNSPELVGKTAVYKGERPAIYAGYLIRVRCSADLLPDYLNYCLNSPAGRDYCWQVKSDAISQSNINARKLAAFQFELPPIEEQAEIVRRTEVLFAYADRLEARYQAARTQVDRLTPTLLAKAFCGELVPQDPNDEPASVLLERIRAERAAQPAKPKRTQASRKPTITKMTEESVKEAIRQLPKDKFSFDELRENIPGNYDLLKDILFALLSEAEPSLKQVFDREEQAMCFVRAGK